MLEWIAGFIARWQPVVGNAVRDMVHWGLHALASVVYTVFGNVGAAWIVVIQGLDWMLTHIPAFIHLVWLHLDNIITKDIPFLWGWVISQVKQLLHDIANAIETAAAYALNLYHLAIHAIDALDNWVLTHVLVPLGNLIANLRSDLLKWGYFAYQLLNDPAKLAGILVKAMVAALIHVFWEVADVIGTFIIGIVLKNAVRFAKLVETILAAVI